MTTEELIRVAKLRRRLESGEAKELRIAAGLTLSEAAGAVGVSPTSLWRYESGRMMPRADHALAYARFLDRLERSLQK